MEIVWLGYACFRLRGREATVLIDPYDRTVGTLPPRLTADIVLITHPHPGHNNLAAVSHVLKVIQGPGEYEVRGVEIIGVQTYHDAENGRRLGRNTAYAVTLDEVVVCHLGDLGHVLTPAQVEQLSGIDVLLVPVGGQTTIGATEAAEVISLLEPRVIVPMHYQTPDLRRPQPLDPVEKFLREMGLTTPPTPQPRLSLTRGTLPEEPQVVLLEPRHG